MRSPKAPYSLLLKKEKAHSDPIYCGTWTSIQIENASAKDFIITGGLDCCVKIWTLKNNQLELMHTLKEHTMAVLSVAASPDGHTLASTSLDGSLIIWEVVTGTKVHNIQADATDVWKVVFSPDGIHVASGGHSGRIMIYSIVDGRATNSFDTRAHIPSCMDWSKDGKYICMGSIDGTVCIYDVTQSKLVHTMHSHEGNVRSVAISSDSKQLAMAGSDGKLKLYDIASASLINSVTKESWATAVCFCGRKEGERLACARADGSVSLLQMPNLTELHVYREHKDIVWSLCFNPSGDKLLSVSKDKCLNIYICPMQDKDD